MDEETLQLPIIQINGTLVRHIIIQGELASLNQHFAENNKHWSSGNDVKGLYTNFVRLQTKNKYKDLGKEDYPVAILMNWYTKDLKKDPDNVAFAKKYILDAFVENKLLKNDGRKQICGLADLYYVDKLRPRIEVFIYTVK